MSVIIRLQNLPLSASSMDIRGFFRGLSIPDGGVHIVGGELADAFIAFSTDEDARQAMALSGSNLQNSTVRLLLSSRNEMFKVIEQARQKALGILPNATTTQTSAQAPTSSNPLLAAQNAAAAALSASGGGTGLGAISHQNHSLDQNHAFANHAHAQAHALQQQQQTQNTSITPGGGASTNPLMQMQGIGVGGSGASSSAGATATSFPGFGAGFPSPFGMSIPQQQQQQMSYLNPQLLMGATNMFPHTGQQQQQPTAVTSMFPTANNTQFQQLRSQQQQLQNQQPQAHQQQQTALTAGSINPFMFPPPNLSNMAGGVTGMNGLNLGTMPNANAVFGVHAAAGGGGGGGQMNSVLGQANPFVTAGRAGNMGNMFGVGAAAAVGEKKGIDRRNEVPFQNESHKDSSNSSFGRGRDQDFSGGGVGARPGGRRSRFEDANEGIGVGGNVNSAQHQRGDRRGGPGGFRGEREGRGFGRGGGRGGFRPPGRDRDRDQPAFGWGSSGNPALGDREERGIGVGRGVNIRIRGDRDDFRGGDNIEAGGRGPGLGFGRGEMQNTDRDRDFRDRGQPHAPFVPLRDREYNPNNPSMASPSGGNKDKDLRRDRAGGDRSATTRRTKSRSRSRERKRRRSGSRDKDQNKSDTRRRRGSRSRSRDRKPKEDDKKSGASTRERGRRRSKDRNTNNSHGSSDVHSSPRTNKTSSTNRDADDDVLIIDMNPSESRDRRGSHNDVDSRNNREREPRNRERERDSRPSRFDAENGDNADKDRDDRKQGRNRDQRPSRFDQPHDDQNIGGEGGRRNKERDREQLPKRGETQSLFDVDVSLDLESSSIIMQKVPIDTNERDISDFFSDIGLTPVSVRILSDRAGGVKNGNVICEFQDSGKARRATTKDGMSFGRNVISVGLLPPASREGLLRGPPPFTRGGRRGGGGPGFGPRPPRFPVPGPSGESENPFVQAMQAVNEGAPLPRHRLRNPLSRGGGTGGGGSRLGSRGSSGSSTGGLNDSATSVPDEPQDLVYFERPGCVVAVTNIPYQATMDDILKYLEEHLRVAVNRDRIIRRFNEYKQPTGDARIAFETAFEAKKAHDNLVGTEMWGRGIQVSIPRQF